MKNLRLWCSRKNLQGRLFHKVTVHEENLTNLCLAQDHKYGALSRDWTHNSVLIFNQISLLIITLHWDIHTTFCASSDFVTDYSKIQWIAFIDFIKVSFISIFWIKWLIWGWFTQEQNKSKPDTQFTYAFPTSWSVQEKFKANTAWGRI